MKLTDNQVAIAKTAIGADPIPTDHPAMDQLEQAFGEHTFYLDQNGLLVFEPDSEPLEAPEAQEAARLVLIAAWSDDSRQELGAVQPHPTNVVVDLADGGGRTS